MKSTIKQLSLAAILSLAAASAMADMNATSDYYAGGQLGASNSAAVSESGATYGVFGGREFDRSTGFEVGYNHFPNFGGSAVNGGAWSIDAVGYDTYYFDAGKSFGLVGQLGLNYSSISSYGTSSGGVGYVLGGGLRYNVNKNVDIRLIYRHEWLGTNSFYASQLTENMATFGAAYHF